MSLKSSSTVHDLPDVTKAVERLQELERRMKSEEFGFNRADVGNIDKIIGSLHHLKEEVEGVHEELETKTIEASVLRHTLQFLPAQIKAEVSAAVNAARQSNSEELTRLQNTLQGINDGIKSQQDRYTELEKENALLHPERDKVRDDHEDIIAQLNQRMAEKAGKQIILNETRDKLRETNQKIVDLEEGILQLRDDLIQERADARMEKKTLKKAVYDTTMKTREQKEINVVKKVELDGLAEKVFLSESKLDEIRSSIRRFETSRLNLASKENTLSAQLHRDVQTNEDLREKGVTLATTLEDQESSYQSLKSELETQAKHLKSELKSGEKKKKEQTKSKTTLDSELFEKTHTRKLDEGRVKQQNNILQDAKQDLALKAEDAARLRQENIDMEQRIEELGQTHESIVATFQKQIEEMRTQLAKERRERMDLQGEKDTVQKEVDDFRVETQRFMNEMNKKVVEGKAQHDELTREGTSLQKRIRQQDEDVRNTHTRVRQSKIDLEEFRQRNEGEVATLEREITEMGELTVEKQASVVEREPTFQELEKFYEQRMDAYDKMKKEIVAVKNKKLGLDESVKRANRDVEQMASPTVQLRVDIKQRQQEFLDQMKRHASERTVIEKQIYTTGSKLRTAMDENQRFFDENSKFEAKIAEAQSDMDHIDRRSEVLTDQSSDLKDHLLEEWFKDNVLEKEFETRDQKLVDGMGELLKRTERRENVIGDITNKLQSELLVLAQFLDNVAKRRPKESANKAKQEAKMRVPTPPTQRRSPSADIVIETVAVANKEIADRESKLRSQSANSARSTKSTKRH